MPTSLLVSLQLEQPVPRDYAVGLHAMLYTQLKQVNAPLAKAIHETTHNPFSLCAIPRDGFGGLHHNTLEFYVHLLDEALADTFMAALEPNTVFGAGKSFTGQIMRTEPEFIPIEAILENASLDVNANAFELAFRTTTSIAPDNKNIVPNPERVFTSLETRWAEFIGFELPTINWQNPPLRLTQVSTKQKRQFCGEFTAEGFIGTAKYSLFGSSEERFTILVLSSFGLFAGVGGHTAFGCGALEVRV